ncbi:MAG: ATP synthase F1 subunit delta [Oscillospiraceae bacterium]|nr:ATP synthase F1 subunit delta [Oscillospiraceae bacterium]
MPASIEKTYADALFSLIKEEKGDVKTVFDTTLSELEAVDTVVSGLPDFVKLLSTPTISEKEKLELVEKAFSGKTSQTVYNFLRVLTVKKRMAYFGKIYRSFRAAYNEEFGIAEITVTTSLPLTDPLRESITKRMAEITGKNVSIREKVDKSIIGGIVIDYGNTRLDGSIKTRLTDLKKDIANIIA